MGCRKVLGKIPANPQQIFLKNLTQTVLRFLQVYSKCLSLLCFVRNQEYGKVKIDTSKEVKYLFNSEFCIRIACGKHQKQLLRDIASKLFS